MNLEKKKLKLCKLWTPIFIYLQLDAHWCCQSSDHNPPISVDVLSVDCGNPWRSIASERDFVDLKMKYDFFVLNFGLFKKYLLDFGEVMLVSWLQVRCFFSRPCLLALMSGSLPEKLRLGSLKTVSKGGETLRESTNSSECGVHFPSMSSAEVPIESNKPAILKLSIIFSLFLVHEFKLIF